MAIMRVPVIEKDGKLTVDLPTFTMLADIDYLRMTVEIDAPDDECVDGLPNAERIRYKYRDNPVWDNRELTARIDAVRAEVAKNELQSSG